MAIEKAVEPYELLVRFEHGHVKGAHFKRIEVVREGAVVYSVREMEPEPVAAKEVVEILGSTQAATLDRISELEAENATLRTAVRNAQREIGLLGERAAAAEDDARKAQKAFDMELQASPTRA